MSTPFLLEIPPRGQIEEIGLHDRRHLVKYCGNPEREHALEAILFSLEAFAEIPENREMVCKALDCCAPELSVLAGHVAAINRLEAAVADRDLDARELQAVGDFRRQTANVWAHGRAGQILIDSQKPFNATPAERGPIARNTKGTRVRYLGEILSIKGQIGTLTGEKGFPDKLPNTMCVGIDFSGITWRIPEECPLELIDDLGDQHAVCDASEVRG
jgi:hypothetical protein